MKEFAEKYKSATEEFLNVVANLKPFELDKSDSEGWTPRQVIHHMADSEAQSYSRLRRLIAEPGSSIQGYDEGKWAENSTLGYRSEDIQVSLDVIKAVRESSYLLVTRLKESDLDLSGVHTESGKYTVKNWLETYSKHPVDHANQIREQIK
mgnify:FL=1